MKTPAELICLLVPDFAFQVVRAGVEGPCVLAARAEPGARVLAADPELELRGVRAGRTLAQARAAVEEGSTAPRATDDGGRSGRERASRVAGQRSSGAGGARGAAAAAGAARPRAAPFWVLTPRPDFVRRARRELLEALHAVAPSLEPAEDGVVFVGVADVRWLEPDVERLARRLVACAVRLGYRAVAGIAPGRFVARLTAERARAAVAGEGRAEGTAIDPTDADATSASVLARVADVAGTADAARTPETARTLDSALSDPRVRRTVDGPAFLAPLPVGLLELPAFVRDSFEVLGVTTLGQLQRLSARQVLDRWGDTAVAAWRRARGEDEQPLVPWRAARRFALEVALDAVTTADQLSFALAAPLERLLDDARRRGERPEALTVRLALERGEVRTYLLGLEGGGGTPTSAGSLLALLRLELERAPRTTAGQGGAPAPPSVGDPHLRVIGAHLEIGPAPRVAGQAIDDLARAFLAPTRRPARRPARRRAADPGQAANLFSRRREPAEALAVTLARLRARLGEAALGRIELRSAVRPEGTWRFVPLDPQATADGVGGWGTTVPGVTAPDPLSLLPLPAGRTLRLTPGGAQPIAAPDAADLRDGPCRLSGEWWDDPFERDYYLLRAGRIDRLVYFDRIRNAWFVQGDVE